MSRTDFRVKRPDAEQRKSSGGVFQTDEKVKSRSTLGG